MFKFICEDCKVQRYCEITWSDKSQMYMPQCEHLKEKEEQRIINREGMLYIPKSQNQ